MAGEASSSSPSRHTTPVRDERIGTSVHTVRWPVQKLARVGRPFRRSFRMERMSSQRRTMGAGDVLRSAPRRPVRRATLELGPRQPSRADVAVDESEMRRQGLGRRRPTAGSRAHRAPGAAGRGTRTCVLPGRCRCCRRRRGGGCRGTGVGARPPWPPRGGSGPSLTAKCWSRCPRAGTSRGVPRRTPSGHTPRPPIPPVGSGPSSPKWKRRRTGSRPARFQDLGCVILRVGELEHLGQDADHRIGLGRASGRRGGSRRARAGARETVVQSCPPNVAWMSGA